MQASATAHEEIELARGLSGCVKLLTFAGNSTGASLTDLLRFGGQIKGTRVSGSIPEEGASLVRLETLDLSNNILSAEVPSEVANLEALREVDLRSNDHLTMPTFVRNMAERSTKLQVL